MRDRHTNEMQCATDTPHTLRNQTDETDLEDAGVVVRRRHRRWLLQRLCCGVC